MRKILIVLSALLGLISVRAAAQDPNTFLHQKYPQLCGIFENDLDNVHCNYIFAVDVSGTMNKLAGTVQPAMVDFIKALPDGDYIRIIKFGNEAKANVMGYVGRVGEVRNQLVSSMSRLYSDTNDRDIRSLTNIPNAVSAISESLANSESDLNFVFILTDFKNEEDRSLGNRISTSTMESLRYRIEQVTKGKNGRVVILKLPLKPNNMKGYCCDQVEKLYEGLDLRSETQPIPDGSALGQWFRELRKEVLVSKLRAIVDKENRVAPVQMNLDINIDGKVVTDISWEKNRLFNSIKLDSTSMVPAGSKYYFKNNKKAYFETAETKIEKVKLGQIKNHSTGFSICRDSLKLGVSLPTPFDDELSLLGVKKPIPSAVQPVGRMLFTFFLPFWLCVMIIILIIIYILLFFRALGVNKNKRFDVRKIRISDASGDVIAEKAVGRRLDGFSIPGIVSAPGLPGQLTFYRRNGNPFLLFDKPTLRVKSTCMMKCGSSCARDIRFQRSSPIKVGRTKTDLTHSITVS